MYYFVKEKDLKCGNGVGLSSDGGKNSWKVIEAMRDREKEISLKMN